MKELKLKIKIDKSASAVFEFTTNPKNTPLWVSSIIKEETNEWPVKLGTIYRNTSDGKKWNEYVMTEFEKDKMFTMSMKCGNYHVKYTFTPSSDNSCELEYFEWVDEAELEEPFTIEILQKLKEVMEEQ